ncbi:DUF2523 domain-containing protein [Aggregatibacter aphrophilus]|jgi:hypothetical protein|uniref:DUF2523 family protein n=1 Tax=Aggregatibacter aphrophilus TaxID=732 RepID=UPI0009F43218|nr:DUF2523 family protein [Aggregatibacter aphrophilus]PNL93544.1 DUF2523 domain-containing protein [Aggregatibacter aphrophilus]
MYGIIFSALSSLMQFLFRGIVIKFFIFFALFYVTTEFIPIIIEMFLPKTIPNIKELFNVLPDSILYFLYILKIPTGITIFISALLSCFIIRRLPIIG